MQVEEYKNINGFINYSVSNFGNIRNNKTQKPIKIQLKPNGYQYVDLCSNGVRTRFYVHRLVMQTFVKPSELTVNHIDHNPLNNHLSNLEYCTQEQNCQKKIGQNELLKELPEGSHELFTYNGYNFVNIHFDKDFNLYIYNGSTYFRPKLVEDKYCQIADENRYYVKIYINQLLQGNFNQ